jgi:hypothetical protein
VGHQASKALFFKKKIAIGCNFSKKTYIRQAKHLFKRLPDTITRFATQLLYE